MQPNFFDTLTAPQSLGQLVAVIIAAAVSVIFGLWIRHRWRQSAAYNAPQSWGRIALQAGSLLSPIILAR
jgi:hypothetical protein